MKLRASKFLGWGAAFPRIETTPHSTRYYGFGFLLESFSRKASAEITNAAQAHFSAMEEFKRMTEQAAREKTEEEWMMLIDEVHKTMGESMKRSRTSGKGEE